MRVSRFAEDSGRMTPDASVAPSSGLMAVPSRARRRRLGSPLLRRLLGVAAAVAAWQALSSAGVIDPHVLASPATAASTAWALVQDGQLPQAARASLLRVLAGLAIGGAVGTGFGLLSGLSRLGEELVDAPLQMLRTVPFAGLVPLFIIWFGIGETPKIALVAFAVAFPLYLNVYAGIRSADAGLVETAATLGVRGPGLVWHVLLPSALPQALVGLRYSLGLSWLALIFAEQINAVSGIGRLMNDARDLLQTDVIVVCLCAYALLGLLSDVTVRGLERLLLGWRPVFRGA
jgi:sulfonate transport system permease protein